MVFQLLSRTRPQNRDFRVRSAARDAETDRSRANSVLAALEGVIREAEQEQSGLNRRVEDVLARAAVTIGNGADEYLERDALDSHHQTLFGSEISNGQRRLDELAATIAHFQFLKAALLSRFPNVQPATSTT